MAGPPAAGVAEPADPPDWVAALGDDPTCAFVARHWHRAAAQPGAWFDAALAEAAVTVWPTWFRHTEGRWAGKPFHLVPWQAAIVRLLVGWRAADGFRLFRRLFLWIGRKNGKTEFLAALAVLFWLCERGRAGAAVRRRDRGDLHDGAAGNAAAAGESPAAPATSRSSTVPGRSRASLPKKSAG